MRAFLCALCAAGAILSTPVTATAVPAVSLREPTDSLPTFGPIDTAPVFTWYSAVLWNETVARDRAARVPAEHHTAARVTVPASHEPRGCVIPCCVVARESGGDYGAQNPVSSASGKYQMLDSSFQAAARGAGLADWAHGHAKDAPAPVQDAAARWLWRETSGAAWYPRCW